MVEKGGISVDIIRSQFSTLEALQTVARDVVEQAGKKEVYLFSEPTLQGRSSIERYIPSSVFKEANAMKKRDRARFEDRFAKAMRGVDEVIIVKLDSGIPKPFEDVIREIDF